MRKMHKRRILGMKGNKKNKNNKNNKAQNPILLLNSFAPLAETSIIDQTSTMLEIKHKPTTLLFQLTPTTSNFLIVVNVLIYAPQSQLNAMVVFDSTSSNISDPNASTRIYNQAFQLGFGKNDNAYGHAVFYLSGASPLNGSLFIFAKHPPCKRRIITVEQFANISVKNPTDQLTTGFSTDPGILQISSGVTPTTKQQFELVYGSIAIGRDFNQFIEPEGFIPIQSVGSNIDTFDATLKTFYQLTSNTGQFGMSALVSNIDHSDFVWSAGVQTFKADVGS